MRKPLISAGLEMGGFVLVEASAPISGEHKTFWVMQSFRLWRHVFSKSLTMGFNFAEIIGEIL